MLWYKNVKTSGKHKKTKRGFWFLGLENTGIIESQISGFAGLKVAHPMLLFLAQSCIPLETFSRNRLLGHSSSAVLFLSTMHDDYIQSQ